MMRACVWALVVSAASVAAAQDYPLPEASEEPGVRGAIRKDSRCQVELVAGSDRWATYTVYVPEGCQQLHVQLEGSASDVDLFLRYEQPMEDWFAESDHSAATGAGDELLLVDAHVEPALRPGKYYLDVVRAGDDSTGAIQVTVRFDHVDVEAYLRRATMRRWDADAQGALEDCDRALALDKKSAPAYHQRALARAELPEPDRVGAAADFAKAVQLDPELEGALEGTIRESQEVAFRLDDEQRYRSWKLIVPAGCQALRVQVVASQQDVDLFLRHGLPMNRWEEEAEHHGDSRRLSEELFVDAREEPPLLPGVYYLDALRVGAAAPDEALTLKVTFDPTIDLAKDAGYWFTRGYAAADRADYEGAAECYSKALAIQPDALTHFNRGAMRRGLEDYAASNADFEAALSLEPDLSYKATLLHMRGNNHRDLKQLDLSVRDLREALALEPEQADFHASLGKSLLAQGELSAAEAALRQALELDPQHGDACYHLAQLRAAQGALDEALELYEQALALGSGDAEVWSEEVEGDQTVVLDLPAGPTNFHTVLLVVPEGVSAVRVVTRGATGDVDLFARYGLPMRNWTADPSQKADGDAADETLTIPTPQPGRYFLDVGRGQDAGVGKFQVLITYVRQG